jgi:beta-lactamase regulating signal transducer with metallopeptidase domain
MNDAAILDLILQSALRSLLLGLCVYAVVKCARLRDLSAETAIWSAVLIAALVMPALTAWLPGMALRVAVAAPQPAVPSTFVAVRAPTPWLVAHAGGLAMAAYALIAAAGLARLAVGLGLTAHLYNQAEPVAEPWAQGRDIRESAAIRAPLSFARAILLPRDWRDWGPAKLQAVLAHEDCHVRRGDFFILLLASAHRAIFWFSPFAWRLQAHLSELAETASDKAAIRRIADPAGYAEILIDVARRASQVPAPVHPALGMGMARGPGIARRIDHILADLPERTLGVFGRALALGAVLTLSFGLAAVRAAVVGPDVSTDLSAPAPQARNVGLRPHGRAVANAHAAARPLRARHIHTVRIAMAGPAPSPPRASAPQAASPQDAFTYDPRALLEQPAVIVAPAAIVVGRSSSADADN